MKLRLLLAVFAIAVYLSVISAQTASLPPDTTPPSLAVVILLDDSLTNGQGRGNSPLPGVRRDPTDPRDYRAQAVLDMVRQLHADVVTHRVGVFSYTTTGVGKWLSGTSESPFITVGNDGDQTQIDALVSVLQSARLGYEAGPGDPASALERIITPLNDLLNANSVSPYKPLIVLVADDVPIRNFNQSPWVNQADAWKRDYLPLFEDPLLDMATNPYYNGFCKQENGGVLFAAFPMGAAAWIDADGSQNPGQGNYYQTLSQKLDSSLVFPIDPMFSDTTGDQVAEDFEPATLRLMTDARCLRPVSVNNGQMQISDLYRSFYLTADIPGNTGEIEIRDPEGNVVTGRRVDSQIGDTRRLLFTFDRTTQWAGTWEIEAPDTALLNVVASVDLSGLSARIDSEIENLTPNELTTFDITLLRNGEPLNDDTLIQSLNGRMESANGTFEFEFDKVDGRYTFDIPRTEVPNAGNYTITLSAQLASIPGLENLSELAVNPEGRASIILNFGLGVSFNLGNIQPESNSAWCVDGGQQEIRVPIGVNDDTVSMDSIGSYTRVELYYPALGTEEAEISPTPFAILGYQAEATPVFSGSIDCTLLQAGNQQQVQVQVQFVNGQVIPHNLFFRFNPTSTPTLTPTPIATQQETATPAPTPTPPPLAADHVDAVVTAVSTPPISFIVVIIAVTGGLIVLSRSTVFYLNTFLPLYYLYLKVEGNGVIDGPHRLLPIWKLLIPFLQSQTITTEMLKRVDPNAPADNRALFRLTGRGNGVDVRSYSNELIINNQSVRANRNLNSTRRETVIEYNQYRFTLTNRKVR